MTYTVDAGTVALFDQAGAYFDDPISELVYFEKYSRWNPELGRREVWPETVKRATDFLRELSEDRLPDETYDRIHRAILHREILPSMRLMAMAGPAARRSHITLYNCGYQPIDSISSFVEALTISMSGTGLGYSVERKYTDQLPVVIPQRGASKLHFTVPDSAEGWAEALKLGLRCWFDGFDIVYDFSKVRPAGAILHTKGGRASGPDPLEKMLAFARQTILSRQCSKLSSLNCHDIMGNIALGAVSGGHRRSAMIALYTWDDQEMRHCKDGSFWNVAPWRTTANNSAVVDDGSVDERALRDHLRAMVDGGNGEPGLFSRVSTRELRPERRDDGDFGTNPCGEIGLNPREFCNLTEVVCTPSDTTATLHEKTTLATIVGTIQSMATNFPGLRSSWKDNCERERLLGVGFTGQMDCPTIQDGKVMDSLKAQAVLVNKLYAIVLGINQSASITCVKPSGSTSLLTNAASGLHARWAPYYERNIRLMATGPVAKTLLYNGADVDPENGQTWDKYDTLVAHFPMASPKGAVTRGDRTAVEQMEYWKLAKLHLTEHNPSVTITYRPEEIASVEEWVVANIGIMGGMSWLPHFDEDINLKQMPNREMTQGEYEQAKSRLKKIRYGVMTCIEQEDQTTAAQEVACSAGQCEL